MYKHLSLATLALSALALVAHAQTSACTNYYTSSIAVPSGYGAAYNLFSAQHEPLVSVSCSGNAPLLTVGSNHSNQYIYKTGYVYQGGWQPLPLTGTGLSNNAWYPQIATASLPSVSSSWTYVVGYVCQWNGTTWQCGCHDTTCSTGMWQLQAYESANASATGVTITPGQGSITDGQGTTWAVTSGGQIARNGTVDSITNGVVLLLYYNGTIYQ
jgi:hypothetical protein